MAQPTDLLTTREVCDRFRVSKRSLFEWVRKGRIQAYKLGPKSFRYSCTEVERFLRESSTTREDGVA